MSNGDKIILDLCGGTGAWSRPYKEAGYDVIVVDNKLPDIEPVKHSETHYHIQDIRKYADEIYDADENYPDVYGILAAPPCDHFAVSGAQYWKQKDADGRTGEGLSIVYACLKIIELTKPVFWALENPVGRLKRYIGNPTMYFNPCDYGDPWTKKTCLWGRFNIPKKSPVEPVRVCKQGSWVQRLGGKSEKTKRLRSITPPGFAKAFFEANR